MDIVELAKRIARAVSRAELKPDLTGLFTPPTVWTLAYLLAQWRMGRDLSADGLSQFATAFGWFRNPLERFIVKAESARDDAALAGASKLFLAVVDEIGADRLRDAMNSSVFRMARDKINRDFPPPAELTAPIVQPVAYALPVVDRIRDYDRFGYRSEAPPTQEVAFFRAQLKRTEIAPDLRWFYEEKLRAVGQFPYETAADALAVWRAMLAGPLHPDLRRYYTENLDSLLGRGTVEV